ncbi:MAG TPA: phosphoribosylformylglycinamidine synthase subunit PurS [Thermomicrobiales bacterium]|nr:phosphoribosylformylglycinamidine synthase subunit PurS [Thermomicrobiales bacterium]
MRRWTVKAIIMPKHGVNDPQGEAIKGGLQSLEFSGIEDVRAGKQIAIMLEARSREEAVAAVERMCEQLLANPVIETYSISADEARQESAT